MKLLDPTTLLRDSAAAVPVAAVLGFVAGGDAVGFGALAGGLLAFGNAAALSVLLPWLANAQAQNGNAGLPGALLILKTGASLGLFAVLIRAFGPVGVLLGLTGVLYAPVLTLYGRPSAPMVRGS